MPPTKWEIVDPSTKRMRTPNGWLVKFVDAFTGETVGGVYVPDADDEWNLEEDK